MRERERDRERQRERERDRETEILRQRERDLVTWEDVWSYTWLKSEVIFKFPLFKPSSNLHKSTTI